MRLLIGRHQCGRLTPSSFATPAPPGTALALRARASVRRTAGAVQVSSPVGQLPGGSGFASPTLRQHARQHKAPTFRTPAGSAAARGSAKTPKSRIAFPLEARIARLQSTLAPLPCQSAQALRDRSPPARLFTQCGELLGARLLPERTRLQHHQRLDRCCALRQDILLLEAGHIQKGNGARGPRAM